MLPYSVVIIPENDFNLRYGLEHYFVDKIKNNKRNLATNLKIWAENIHAHSL